LTTLAKVKTAIRCIKA